MNEFSTCFPAGRSVSNESFLSLAISWLNGMKASQVLSGQSLNEMHEDDAFITAENNEALRIKKVSSNGISAIGLQHEIPDNQGRIWRTECVVTRGNGVWVHVRGQCILAEVGAVHQRPKKPFLIKMMLRDGWASIDGAHIIDNYPHRITHDEVDLARRIVTGCEPGLLPQIYVSRDDKDQTILNEEKLAFDLGGLAHVFVEPSRRFSILLMSRCGHKNPYGGSVAVCIPGRGVIRKFYRRSDDDRQDSLTASMIDVIVQYHASINRPYALDWRALQEAQSRELRKIIGVKIRNDRASDGEEIDEYISAFDAELAAKDLRIAELEGKLSDAISAASDQITGSTGVVPDGLADSIGSELYQGEISDRVRRAIREYMGRENLVISKRDAYVLRRFLELSSCSGRSVGLISELKTAGRDVKEMPSRVGAILSRIGFSRSEEGKHLKFSPPSGLGGIDVAVLPKTSSDHRAGKNQVSDLIEGFSIRDLNKE